MNKDKLLSIIVVNWNTCEITKKCILAIEKHVKINYELIIVDNGSKDASVDYFRSISDTRVKTVFCEKNLGFAKANNIGIKKASGEFICLINSDAYVTKFALENMIECMETTNAGMVGPLTNRSKGMQCKRSFYRFIPTIYNKFLSTDYLSFFCVLINKHIIDTVGYLDESFGLGTFEDDDYCRRVQEQGYKLIIDKRAWVWHDAHATMKANSLDEEQLVTANRKIFNLKWENRTVK